MVDPTVQHMKWQSKDDPTEDVRRGKEELEQVGAYRVYLDPADLLAHLDEVGIRIMD